MARIPGQCEVCRAWGQCGLCAACAGLFARPVPRCRRCGLRLPDGLDTCGECLRDPPPFDHTLCVADHAFPWNRLVEGFKFNQRPELAVLLARALGDSWSASAAAPPQVFVPVPLSAARLAERGYNQAWEIARRLATSLGVAADGGVLQRRFDTPHQAALTRTARLTNLRGSFVVDGRRLASIVGRRVALVDDVMTTGATVREAAAVLRAARAAAVDVWVLTRTPAS